MNLKAQANMMMKRDALAKVRKEHLELVNQLILGSDDFDHSVEADQEIRNALEAAFEAGRKLGKTQ